MFISVDTYEEMYLKDKDAKVVENEVQKLRNEISRIKRKMEMPSYVYSEKRFPTDDQIIEMCREYFKKAIEVLGSFIGADNALTEEEKSAALTDSMTYDISCLTLTVGRHFEYKFELDISDLGARIMKTRLGEETTVEEKDRDAMLSGIYALHLGEWKASYMPQDYECTLNEPVKWQVRIDYYGAAAPRFYDGVGIFPYNFSMLCKLLGAEWV